MDTAKKTQGTPRTAPQVRTRRMGPRADPGRAGKARRLLAGFQLPGGRANLPARQPPPAGAVEARTHQAEAARPLGNSPGLNMLCVHLNRVIKRDDLNMIYIIGPGHGGPSLVAHAYLEGTRQRGRARLRAQEPGRTDHRPLESRR